MRHIGAFALALFASGCSMYPTHAGIIAVDGSTLVSSAGVVTIHAPSGTRPETTGLGASGAEGKTVRVTSALEGVVLTCEVGCTAEAGRDYVTLNEPDPGMKEFVIVVSKSGYVPARVTIDAAAGAERPYRREVVVLFPMAGGAPQ